MNLKEIIDDEQVLLDKTDWGYSSFTAFSKHFTESLFKAGVPKPGTRSSIFLWYITNRAMQASKDSSVHALNLDNVWNHSPPTQSVEILFSMELVPKRLGTTDFKDLKTKIHKWKRKDYMVGLFD